MDLFGPGYLAFQGTVIGGQRFAKDPLPLEQQAEVNPVIGSIRIKCEQVPIGFARLIIARRAIQRGRLAGERIGRVRHQP
jgi:hypothetical protein